jgi:hypothetical protein
MLAALALIAVTTLSSAGGDDESARLHQLFDDWKRWRLQESPRLAMERGDYAFADRLDDESIAAFDRRPRRADRVSATDCGRSSSPTPAPTIG